MPVGTHLQWFDIADFTAGIWDATAAINQFAAPANAFVTLDDYQPMKGGGVRAFHKATSTSLSGVGANEVPTGLFARNGVSRPTCVGGTGTDSTDIILVTMNTSDFKARIYRRDGTVGAPAWSLRHTTAAAGSAGHQVTGIEYFKDINGVEWYLISMFGAGNNTTGLFTMRQDYTVASNTGNDGLVAKIQSYGGPIVISQARIIIGTGNDEKLQYSGVGLTTGFGSSLSVVPNRGEPNISIISGIEPSDLLIGKEGAPWVQISGDITSTATPVREMGDSHHQRQNKQQVPRVPDGIAFIEGGGRVFVTTDGRTFRSLSDSLARFSLNISPGMVGTGQMGFLNDLLFAPGPSGKTNVFDYSCGCWFRSTGIQSIFASADPYGGMIWCVDHTDTSPSLVSYSVFANSRVSTGIIQTVPFADKNGRNVDIREVQLFVQCYSSSTFIVELIDQTGASVVTRTVSGITDRQMVQFLFPNTKSEYLSIKVTPSATNGTSEAPTIERMRIGFGYNNIVA